MPFLSLCHWDKYETSTIPAHCEWRGCPCHRGRRYNVYAENPRTAWVIPDARPMLSDMDLDTKARATGANAIWIQPGVRNLDPVTFGTVQEPLGTEFFIGVPLYNRLDDGAGNWTTTALPTEASNNTLPLASDAECRISVHDRTPTDLPSFGATSQDRVSIFCRFTDPFGRLIEITSRQPLPRGPFHEFFGGVATNIFLHGRTGLGGKLPPQVFTYIATWSLGEIKIDGQLLPGNDNRLIHTMVTQGVRDATNNPGNAGGTGPFLGTTAEVDHNDLELHLVLPPVRFMPGPLPNRPVVGFGQEFVHLVFEDVTLQGSAINGTLSR